MTNKGPVRQCICDRFIVELCRGLPTQSTDMTFQSLAHSICSAGLPTASRVKHRAASPRPPRVHSHKSRVLLNVLGAWEVYEKAACFATGRPPAKGEKGTLICVHTKDRFKGCKGSCPIFFSLKPPICKSLFSEKVLKCTHNPRAVWV